jgi:hypothetical protein
MEGLILRTKTGAVGYKQTKPFKVHLKGQREKTPIFLAFMVVA